MPILGTSAGRHRPRRGPRALRRSSCEKLELRQPENGMARSAGARRSPIAAPHRLPGAGAALLRARRPGDGDRLRRRAARAATCHRGGAGLAREQPDPDRPFLEDAIEVDVDCVGDGTRLVIGGVMEHIEEAGIHSGDSACACRRTRCRRRSCERSSEQAGALARQLGVVGLMNVQFAVQGRRHLRAGGEPARLAHRALRLARPPACRWRRSRRWCMVGKTLAELGVHDEIAVPTHVAVKESVFPFTQFPGVDTILGPGDEVHRRGDGHRRRLPARLRQGQSRPATQLPLRGRCSSRCTTRTSRRRRARRAAGEARASSSSPPAARRRTSARAGCPARRSQGERGPAAHRRPLIDGEIELVFNTTSGKKAIEDSYSIRRETLMTRDPVLHHPDQLPGAVAAIEALCQGPLTVKSLQEYHLAGITGGEVDKGPPPRGGTSATNDCPTN